MKVKGLLVLLLVLLILIVAGFIGSQNDHLVLINYLLAETQIRMYTILAITFSLGTLLSLLLFMGYILRLKWRISMLERKNKKLTQASTPV
jgi:putative membrane protein